MKPSSRRLGSRQGLQDRGRSSRKNKRRGGESQPHQVVEIVDRSAEVRDVRHLSVESRAKDYCVRYGLDEVYYIQAIVTWLQNEEAKHEVPHARPQVTVEIVDSFMRAMNRLKNAEVQFNSN